MSPAEKLQQEIRRLQQENARLRTRLGASLSLNEMTQDTDEAMPVHYEVRKYIDPVSHSCTAGYVVTLQKRDDK